MRTIIAGSRTITDYFVVNRVIAASKFPITVVVSGTAQGVDKLGEQWAENNMLPVARYPANWKEQGKSAGYQRNALMASNADALIACWDGESKGTKHMIDIAKKAGLKVFVCLCVTKETINGPLRGLKADNIFFDDLGDNNGS